MEGNACILTDLVPILNDIIGKPNDEAPKPSSPFEVPNQFLITDFETVLEQSAATSPSS
jgi:hypothetical protein